jgi:hypothetical protein
MEQLQGTRRPRMSIVSPVVAVFVLTVCVYLSLFFSLALSVPFPFQDAAPHQIVAHLRDWMYSSSSSPTRERCGGEMQ